MTKNPFQSAVCTVTGGASGIGRALCQRLVTQGAKVISADLHHPATANIEPTGSGTLRSVGLDVRDRDGVHGLIDEVVHENGRIDYLFNCAGVNVLGEFADLTIQDWQHIVDVNLWGVVFGCQAAYPHMIRQRKGHIVNISSGLGLTAAPRNSAYAATKHAIVGLSEALRIEGADLGVNVSVVCPGWIKTPMLDRGRVAGDDHHDLCIADVASHLPFRFADVDRTVRHILTGVRRKKPMIIYPGYVRTFVWLYRLARPLSDWWNREEMRAFRRFRGKTGKGATQRMPAHDASERHRKS